MYRHVAPAGPPAGAVGRIQTGTAGGSERLAAPATGEEQADNRGAGGRETGARHDGYVKTKAAAPPPRRLSCGPMKGLDAGLVARVLRQVRVGRKLGRRNRVQIEVGAGCLTSLG